MKYSIIVPVYNIRKYLPACLDGILKQRYGDFELILVDDGSTDGSGTICDDYAGRDPRVMVIHKENGGQPSARKAGILASSGKYICYVDGDDAVYPQWLTTIDHCVELGNEPDMIVFGAEEITPEGTRPLKCYLKEGYYDRARMEKEVYPYVICDRRFDYTTQLIFPVAWNKAYKRQLLLEHYNRDERIRRGEDTAFVYECLLFSDSLYVSEKILYGYNRMNASSISAFYGFRLTENDVYLANYLRERLKGLGKTVDRQINDFVASKIIRSALYKARGIASVRECARQMKTELENTRLMDHVSLRELPLSVMAVMIALKMRLYTLVLVLAKRRAAGKKPGKSQTAEAEQR